MTIRIKDSRRATISAFHAPEPSDEAKLRFAAWLISDVVRKLGVEEVELAYDLGEADEQR